MNRRASLPGADELFRASGARDGQTRERSQRTPEREGSQTTDPDTPPTASGRVRHDQKITVYLTEQELLDLEQARLRLRAEFDLSVDRGRIVREAIAEVLADLYERGPDSDLVRRLT
ncbi:MAG: hypothetical protein ACLFRD_09600 [Nitriliruptoraceae bacterium]